MNRRALLAALLMLPALGSAARGTEIEMMDPDESIALEHQTRSRRLRRLVGQMGVRPYPDFYEYVIPARIMPPDFRHDTPVLRVVFPESTFFDTATSEILPSAEPIIVAMARMLEGDVPDVALFVAGHADSRGAEDYNYALSVRRAKSVARALRQAGASLPDIWSVGFGESLPLYENSTPTNMAFNRRVEFLFAARPEAAANWLKDQMDLACSGGDDASKQRCLAALHGRKVRKSFVVEQVERTTVVQQPRPSTMVAQPPHARVVNPPANRQIVINLAERQVVVKQPEH